MILETHTLLTHFLGEDEQCGSSPRHAFGMFLALNKVDVEMNCVDHLLEFLDYCDNS